MLLYVIFRSMGSTREAASAAYQLQTLKKTVVLTYLRYALATICFALSVACLGLWWRSHSFADLVMSPAISGTWELLLGVDSGSAYLAIDEPMQPSATWRHLENDVADTDEGENPPRVFGMTEAGFWFPLWYPALVFALAGVGALRLGRRFTLRSALIATTVAAGLLGMVVAL